MSTSYFPQKSNPNCVRGGQMRAKSIEHSRRMKLIFAASTDDAREWERRHTQKLEDAIRVAKAQGTMR